MTRRTREVFFARAHVACRVGSTCPCEFPFGWGRGSSTTQSNGDRTAIRYRFRASSAEMAAPLVAPERDTLAVCGVFTGLFACLFVRRKIRRAREVF